jgi:hypothetical protein
MQGLRENPAAYSRSCAPKKAEDAAMLLDLNGRRHIAVENKNKERQNLEHDVITA